MIRKGKYLIFTKDEFEKISKHSKDCMTCYYIVGDCEWEDGSDERFCKIHINSLSLRYLKHIDELGITPNREWSIS